MSITRDFKLSLVAGRSIPLVINANQYDDGEIWRFTLLDENGQKYSPSTGSIIGLKSDGHIIANAGTVSSTGLVIIAETEQMTASPGKNFYELLIDDDTHGTANFIVFVEPRPGADGTPSDSDLAVFQEAIDAAAQIGDASELVDDVAVLKSRMDEFTTLTDGSTTGDAELADIRVGADGTIYPNAGDAVRGQVSDLKNALNNSVKNNMLQILYSLDAWQFQSASTRLITKNKFDATNSDVYVEYDSGYKIYIYGYDSNNNVVFDRHAWYSNGNPVYLPKGYFYTVTLAKTDNAVLSADDLSHVRIYLTVPINRIANLENPSQFVVGNFDTVNKRPNTSVKYRVCTENLLQFDANAYLYMVDTDFICYVAVYDSSDEYVTAQSWSNGDGYIVNPQYKYGITIKRRTENTSEVITYGSETFYQFCNALAIIYFDENYVEKNINEANERIDVLETEYNSLATTISATGKDSIAPLIYGISNDLMYAKIDTTNKIITFPSDTVIINNTSVGSKYIILNDSSGTTTCDYSSVSSSAVRIYFDPTTNTWQPRSYAGYENNMILIATIRNVGSYVSANMYGAYTINGKLFGLDLEQYISNMPTPTYFVKGINHRGANLVAPENTLPAFRISKKLGFACVETDVAFTSDNVAVLLHDETVDRTSDGTGNISQLTYDYVRSLDFGSWFSSEYAGTKIPSLDEFLTLCRNLSLHPYLELKNAGNYTQAQINSVVDMVKSHGMTGNVTYISFSYTFLTWIKQKDSKARIGYLANDVDQTIITNALSLKTNENEVFIDCAGDAIDSDVISLCITNDFPLETWTFDNASSIVALDPYVTGVTSDNLIAGRVLHESSIED